MKGLEIPRDAVEMLGAELFVRVAHISPHGVAGNVHLMGDLRPGQAARTGARRPRAADQRSDLNAARISAAKSSGSSQAAKWPPLSATL